MQEVAELEAQRKAFTSRLPKVRAESEAIRNEEARSKNLMASVASASSSASPPPPSSPQSAEGFHDERRQQQLHALKREGGAADEVGGGGQGGGEVTLEDFPYQFLAEDQEPEEGINIYDVEANIAAARAAAKAAAEAGPSPPAPQQPQGFGTNATQPRAFATAEDPAAAPQGFAGQYTSPPPSPLPSSLPRNGHPNDSVNCSPPAGHGVESAATRRAEPPSMPPPRPQQAAAGVDVRADTNAVGGHGAWNGAATGGGRRGGGGDAGASRNRAAAAAADMTAWSTPSSEAPFAVTVMGVGAGGAGAGGGVGDTAVMERVAREAEEQTERMDEDDDVFEGAGLVGW